jgi:uncharacterized protein YciI
VYLLMARYTRPVEEVDALLEDHKAWIGRNADKILLTAREEPLIGGMILARAGSLDEIWAMIRDDPFHAAGMSEYEVREYNPVRAAPGVEGLLEPQG